MNFSLIKFADDSGGKSQTNALLLFLFFIFSLFLPARAELLPIKTYFSSDGLSYDKIYSIYQDSRGFIWFTSPSGISRFDGYKFVTYGLENGLEDAFVIDMVEDANGVYWFTTGAGGVYRFAPKESAAENSNEIKNLFQLVSISNTPDSNRASRFCKTRRGEIFVGTRDGLFLLNAGENKFSRVELNLNLPPGKAVPVGALAEDAEGNLWIGHQFGLSRRLPDGAIINYEVFPQANGTDSIRSLVADAQNRVWIIAESGKKLVVFNPEPLGLINASDAAKRKLRFKPENNLAASLPQGFAHLFTKEEGLEAESFMSVYATKDNRIWLCSYGKGLYSFDGREFRLYTRENGLSDNTVRNVTEDNFGNLWISSDWGAMKFTRSSFTTYRIEDGLTNERIDSILQDRNGIFYVVTPEWNINRFDGRRFTTVKLNLPPVGNYLSDRVLSDHAGEWWFATGNGLYRYAAVDQIEKLASAEPSAVYTTQNGLPGNQIRVVFEDSRRNVWFSFEDKPGNLTRWKRETGEFQNFGAESGIPEGCVPQIFREDAAGNIYTPCYTENILFFQNERFQTFTHEAFAKTYWISDILIDRKGRLWAATPTKGLLKIENLATGNPVTRIYTHADGLSGDSGQFLAEDNFGKIYYLNANGLDAFEPETEKVKKYTIAEVLAGLGNGTAFRDRSGDLWFGGHRGISRFTPLAEKSQSAPQIYISAVRAAGRDVPVSAIGDTEISGLKLESDGRQIQIEYFGLALATGERLRYQYKLESADDNWSEPSEQRIANYPNIAPGDYRFLVRAVSSEGVASAQPASVSFTVLRPIWQRWWFLLLVVFAFGGAVYALYRYRLKRLLELERVRTRIATDLHDDIGSSLSQIAILSEVVRQKVGDNGANEPLNLIANTSREMVDSMSDIVWAINPRKDHLSDLVQRMRRFAEDMFDAKDVAYRFIVPEKTKDVALGADVRREVYLIFKECVNNLIKHSKATRAKIEVKPEGDSLVIEIEDDGCGFNAAAATVKSDGIHLTSDGGYGGNGLPNMIRRAESLGGEFTVESEIGKGTTVKLKIPRKQNLSAGKIRRGVFRSLFLIIILSFSAFFARAGTLPFKKYSTSDGLAHDTVTRIVRDSRGFLWFCTTEGLSRFDGYQFKNYTRDSGLPGRGAVFDLLETRDGQYWLATSAGLVLFNPNGAARRWTGKESEEEASDESRMFRVFRAENQEPGKWKLAILKLVEDFDGNIWCLENVGLYVLKRSAGESKLERVIKEPWRDGKQELWALAIDDSGAIWVAASGIFRILPDGDVQTVVGNLGFVYLYKDKKGYMWAGSGGANKTGLHQFTYNGFEQPRLLRAYTEKDGLMSRNWHYGILETSDGKLWVGSVNGLSESVERFEDGTVKFSPASKLVVGSLAEDSGGNLWVGTESSGAYRLSRSGFKSFDEKDGLKTIRGLSIANGIGGEVYFIWGGGRVIHRFDGDRFTAVTPPDLLEGSWGWNQYHFQDREGDWWIAANEGLQRYPKTSILEELARTKAKKIYTTKDGLPTNIIFRLFEDSRGDIWIGTLEGKPDNLAVWRRATDEIQVFNTAENNLPADNAPTAFAEDRAGNIWIGYYGGGVVRYRSGKFQSFSEKDGIPAGFVREIYADSAGKIWIAALSGGVSRIDAPDDEQPAMVNISTAEGLSSVQASCITEDKFGRIYIGTGRGVNRLDPATGRIKVFTAADGLAENLVHVCKTDKSGALWFSFYNGLSRYVPEPDAPLAPPPVFISDLRAGGAPVKKLSELGETSIEDLELNAEQRQIQIEFFALSFDAGETLRYQYKLANADWSEPTAERVVNFNLSPGSYNFEVRAVNSEGVASEQPARVSFSIARPVWQRWWFLLIAALLFSGLIYALYRYRLRRLLELERVRTRIATDLHDDIGSSLSQIAILSEVVRQKVGDNGANEPLSLIANTSREMVDSMSDIVWAINPQKDHLSDLIHRMRRFAGDVLDAKDVLYRFHLSENSGDIALGADIRREVYLIFKECINNLVKYSEATEVDLGILVENNSLVVAVKDNGKGFDTAEKANGNFEGFGGNGLINMRRRAENLGGTFEIDSKKGAGTSVEIRIPVAGKLRSSLLR